MYYAKPPLNHLFGPEMKRNLTNRFGSFSYVTQKDALNEAYGYALDMCFEFYKKSDGRLTNDWIQHIASEVFTALCKYVLSINILTRGEFIVNVSKIMNDDFSAREALNCYYEYHSNPGLDMSRYID